MSIKEILADLDNGERNKDIADKYNVSPAYVSQVAKEAEIKSKLKVYDVLISLIQRGAIKAYGNKMSDEEKEIWAAL